MKFKRNKNVILRSIAGEHMLIPIKTSSSSNALMMLNETGAYIWGLMEEGISMNDIVQRILEEYNGDNLLIQKEVESFINVLLHKGLIIKED